MKNPEILAPAGSIESVYAAVRCGADAVYLGAKKFSARQNATNFSDDELKEAVDYCHKNGVAVHQAINTVVFDNNFKDLLNVAVHSAEIGVDAFIIEDLGVFSAVKTALPDMPLHASTQMTIHTADGARKALSMGFSRVVLSRELPIETIREICSLPIEVEVFVHGALCMSVSGQCFMSAMIGGRSANRGLCAQSCRLPFSADNSAYHALSLKDLSYIPEIKLLADAGVTSFKIEGRMKRPEYVASAVDALKKSLDGTAPDMDTLRAVFSRSGFTNGYLHGNLGKNMFGIREKDDVTSAKDVLPTLRELYRRDVPRKKLDLEMKVFRGQNVTLTAICDNISVTVTGNIPQEAESVPLDEKYVENKLSKLGGTPFFAGEIRIEIESGLFMTISEINDLRRKATDALSEKLCEKKEIKSFPERVTAPEKHKAKSEPHIRVHLKKAEQIKGLSENIKEIVLPLKEYEKISPDEKILLSPPRFITDENSVREQLKKAYDKGFRHAYCNNISHLETAGRLGFVCHSGYGMNIANSYSLREIKSLGAVDTELSFELKLSQISSLGVDIPRGIIVHGKLPLMLTRNCPIKSQVGCKGCRKILRDRTGREFEVACTKDYAEILNCDTLCLADKKQDIKNVDFVSMLFENETADEINKAIENFEKGKNPYENFTRGLYYRGIE
ncbi:MAG: DUF3656 domain-containing protein [Oscillospiraceae bacterium]